MLLLHQLSPMHWAYAGLAIAAITLVLQFVANRGLGLSSGLEDVCSLASSAPYFRRPELKDRWRFPVLFGLFAGGILSAASAGGWQPIWDAGMLDHALALSKPAKLAWFFAGGIFIGFGTRMAGGCTSGHGIYGMARLQPASIKATIAFMAVGTVTSNLLYRVIFA